MQKRISSIFDPGQKLATDYAFDLPCTHVLRPDWDVGVLQGIGLEAIETHHHLEHRIHGKWSRERLKNPWSHQFLVMAAKP